MGVKDYHELQVYQLAFESAMQIFEMTRAFPREETYSLVDQIRRSSRSVCANIAEAWRKRRYPASFVSKLSDADTEAAETLVWLDFALRCKYINPETHLELYSHYNHICAMLTKMMNDPDSWCGATAQKRQHGA
jgi:four helix bundle protein